MKSRTLLFFLLFSISGWAFGQTLQPFSLPDATSDGFVSLADFQEATAMVIVFTSNYCPYSKLYDERLLAWIDTYHSARIPFLLINPNSKYHPEYESLEEMSARAEEKGITVPYLSDAEQQVSKNLSATRTPEVFVLRKRNGAFQVVYHGALDDNPQQAEDVEESYLTEVLDALVGGSSIPVNQRPTGCMIKRG